MKRRGKLRLLYFTDPHNSDTPPLMRQDTYCTDIINKQLKILDEARGCDAVIIGGDIFHQKKADKVSHTLVNLIGEIYREFPKTFIVVGNHDFENHLNEVFGFKTPLTTLGLLPNVFILHATIGMLDDINIYGIGGGEDYMNSIGEMCAQYFKYHGDDVPFHIGVFHAPISDKKFPFEVIKPREVIRFFNAICLGHLHTYQKVTNEIIAPGSLSRGVLRLDESYDRDVGYALIDVIGEEIQARFVPINVRPADEVFKVNKREQKRLEEAAVGSLLDFIEKLDVPRIMNAEALIEHIGSMNLDFEIEQRAIRILRSL